MTLPIGCIQKQYQEPQTRINYKKRHGINPIGFFTYVFDAESYNPMKKQGRKKSVPHQNSYDKYFKLQGG